MGWNIMTRNTIAVLALGIAFSTMTTIAGILIVNV